MSDALLRVNGSRSTSAVSPRCPTSASDCARRALRPDRAERLGQDDAHQLHLGIAPERRRLDRFRRRGDLRAGCLSAHAARHRAQLPGAPAVLEHAGAREPRRAASSTWCTAARFTADTRRGDGDPAADRARRQGERRPTSSPRSSCASSSSPARWRRARASDLRRGDGRAVLVRGRRDPEDPVPAERDRDHDHHDRAHHARRDAVLAAGDVLDAGKIICEGTPAQTVANPDVQRAYLGA